MRLNYASIQPMSAGWSRSQGTPLHITSRFFSSGGRNHLQYSLHGGMARLSGPGYPGKYQDGYTQLSVDVNEAKEATFTRARLPGCQPAGRRRCQRLDVPYLSTSISDKRTHELDASFAAGRRVAATSTRRGGGDRGGRCPFVRVLG